MVKSCIFYNFFDQCRIGLNGTISLEKCHLSEARNSAIYAINPKNLKVKNCVISKPANIGIKVEWLQESDHQDKCRII